MKKILNALVIIILFFGISIAAAENPLGTRTEKTNTSETNTFFTNLPQADIFGKKIDYDKQLYLIDIWATWCPPCRMTIPELIKLQADYDKTKFAVLGFSVDYSPKPVVNYLENNNFNYQVAMLTRTELKQFPPVRGIPTMFLIDNNGTILKTYVGYTGKDKLAEDIDTFLKE